jgi:hypothetical protein
MTNQKEAAHHKTLNEHPNPPFRPKTDQPKGSCSTQNTENYNPGIGPLTDQAKAAAHHQTISEHQNPPIGTLTDQPKGSCSPQNTV